MDGFVKIYFDVFESFNLLIDKDGQTIDMSVFGKVVESVGIFLQV